MSGSKWVWTSVCCDAQRHRETVHSWFAPMVRGDWGLPLKCDIQEHIETGAEGAMRALYRTEDGRLKEIVRRRNSRTVRYQMRNATPSILAGFRLLSPPSDTSCAEKPGEE